MEDRDESNDKWQTKIWSTFSLPEKMIKYIYISSTAEFENEYFRNATGLKSIAIDKSAVRASDAYRKSYLNQRREPRAAINSQRLKLSPVVQKKKRKKSHGRRGTKAGHGIIMLSVTSSVKPRAGRGR